MRKEREKKNTEKEKQKEEDYPQHPLMKQSGFTDQRRGTDQS